MAVGKYDTHVKPKLLLIEAWARDGLTDLQIAERLDISEASFYKYRAEHKEFTESLKSGKEVIDTQVENALLKAALGYEYDDVSFDKDGKEMFRNTRTAHPNTTALIFWLKNRKPGQWRDKHEMEVSGDINIVVSLPEELL